MTESEICKERESTEKKVKAKESGKSGRVITKLGFGTHEIWKLSEPLTLECLGVPTSRLSFGLVYPSDIKSPQCILVEPTAGTTKAFADRVSGVYKDSLGGQTFTVDGEIFMLTKETVHFLERDLKITDKKCVVCKGDKPLVVSCKECHQFFCAPEECFIKFHTEFNAAKAAAVIGSDWFFSHKPNKKEILKIEGSYFEELVGSGKSHASETESRISFILFCNCLKFKDNKLTPLVKIKQTVLRS